MPARVRSRKQAQIDRASVLRAEGLTWGEVAAVFRAEYRVNARVALRLAHGWSQNEVADRWNQRWPQDLKTFKNISYWEKWPAATGYAPSLEVLTRLAAIYSCQVADLLVDVADHRGEDPVFRARSRVAALPSLLRPINGADGGGSEELNAAVAHLQSADVRDLAGEIALWAAQLDPSVEHRALLVKLGFALTLAAASPADPDRLGPAPTAHDDTDGDLSGVWRSEYGYHSSGRGEHFVGVHYVTLRQQGPSVAVTGLAHSSGSQLGMTLTVDGMVATGSWEERTSPTGYYKGAVYRGALQLLIDPSGGQMTGRWLGFGKRFQINSGDWTLRRETASLDRRTVKKYELKV